MWWGGARAPSADAEPDAAVLDGITVSWPAHTVEYTHRSAEVVSAVAKAHCDLGLVLRPATVDQIARTAHTGRRLPPKTTFFQPKPRTGMILRLLDDPAPRPA
ncbi:MAG: hypothetical protein DLM54_00065 [Acidimicrobiales bacterium]|nr:MAG: hypothetical protein DLM54_00065 [Acidimicrobiales bacterium]